MASYIVAPGAPSAHIHLSAGDTETVESGGAASATIVSSGGIERISSGGSGAGDVVGGGGVLVLSSGAHEAGAIISSGGLVKGPGILSGADALFGIASGVTVGDPTPGLGGYSSLTVYAKGVASNIVVDDSFAYVSSGGVVRGLRLIGGAVESVLSGGATTGAIVTGDDILIDAGSALSSVLSSGAAEWDSAGGISRDTLIHGGGVQTVYAMAIAADATIYAGGSQVVTSHGAAIGTVISNGGLLDVYSGGTASAVHILAGGSEVAFSSSFASGVLISAGGALTISSGGQAFADAAGARTNAGKITIEGGGVLQMGGAFENTGVISMNGVSADADLVVGGLSAQLMGSGVVEFSDSKLNAIGAELAAQTFDNVNNTIEGAGDIGGTVMTLVNGGTIDADAAVNALTVDPTSATNTGLIEATGAGGLVIATSIQNAGGVIGALGGSVYLDSGTTILGGTLSAANGAFIVATGETAALDGAGAAVTLDAGIVVIDTGVLGLAGVIANGGSITINGAGDATDLVVAAASATLSGGGSVNFSDAAANTLSGAAGAVLYNDDNTIDGAANIGAGALALVNSGTLDASAATNAMVLDTTSTMNAGLIEATGAGGLVIETQVHNLGTIAAAGGGVTIDFDAEVSGGTVSGAGGGGITVEYGGKLFGATIVGAATTLVSSGGFVSGVTISDGANIDLLSGAAAVNAVLKSGGTIAMAEGGYVLSATLSSGGTLSGPGLLEGVIIDHGYVSGGTLTQDAVLSVTSGTEVDGVDIASGGVELLNVGANVANATVYAGGGLSGGGQIISAVGDHGDVSGLTVSSGGKLTIAAGGTAENIAVLHFATLVDGGALTYSVGSATLEGTLAGAGTLTQKGPGRLVQSGNAAGFSGHAILSAGVIDLAAASGLGTATIAFEAAGGASATLDLDAPAQPATGSTFASELIDFAASGEALDLTGLTFVSGATAAVAGGVLTLKDGGYTARFDVGGMSATAYTVTKDGDGGTLVTAGAAMMLVHAMAGLGAAGGPVAHGGGGLVQGAAPPLLAAAGEPPRLRG